MSRALACGSSQSSAGSSARCQAPDTPSGLAERQAPDRCRPPGSGVTANLLSSTQARDTFEQGTGERPAREGHSEGQDRLAGGHTTSVNVRQGALAGEKRLRGLQEVCWCAGAPGGRSVGCAVLGEIGLAASRTGEPGKWARQITCELARAGLPALCSPVVSRSAEPGLRGERASHQSPLLPKVVRLPRGMTMPISTYRPAGERTNLPR
jgi:hypothetical protein